MRLRTLHPHHPFHAINATPLIDVVMCLIVFFLIVAKLAADERGRIGLPHASQGERGVAREALVIAVPSEPGSPCTVDGRAVATAHLASLLRERRRRDPRAEIVIRAHRDVPCARLAPVLMACAEAGAAGTTIRLAVEPEP